MKAKQHIVLILFLLVIVTLYVMKAVDYEENSEDVEKSSVHEQKTHEKWTEVSVTVEVEAEIEEDRKEVKKPVPVKKRHARKEPSPKPVSKDVRSPQRGESGFNLLARYMMPVRRYLEIMTGKGARVVLYSTERKAVVSRVNVLTDELTGDTDTSGMSVRGRRITEDYPGSGEVIRMAGTLYGPDIYEVILLLPAALDDQIYGQVRNTVNEKGIDLEKVTSVELQFREVGQSDLSVRIHSVSGTFGRVIVNRTFEI